jgi:Glycosyl transferase family 2
MNSVTLSVIIPTRGPARKCLRLMRSIQAQAFSRGLEVLVVANPPDSRIGAAVAMLGAPFSYIPESRLGANHARNAGLRAARGEILLFLDDDCSLPDPTFFVKHLQEHRAHPDCVAIGGPYVIGEHRGFVEKAYNHLQLTWVESGISSGGEAHFLLGGNLSLKRSMLREEKFDPALTYGGTETELLLRLKRKKMRFHYSATLKLEHGDGISWFTFLGKAFRQGWGAAYIEARNGEPLPGWTVFSEKSSQPFPFSLLVSTYSISFTAGFRAYGARHSEKIPALTVFFRIAWALLRAVVPKWPLSWFRRLDVAISALRANLLREA